MVSKMSLLGYYRGYEERKNLINSKYENISTKI